MKVVGLGAMNMDHLYRVPRLVKDGEALIKVSALCPGGSAANTIYGLARLGVETGFVGAVGDDGAGEVLIDDLRRAGSDTNQIRVKAGMETGSVLAFVGRRGQRALYVSPGANAMLSEEDVELGYFSGAEVVHLSSFAGQGQLELQRRVVAALGAATKVSFAPGELYASMGLETLAPILQRTQVLFLNRRELKMLTAEGVEKGPRRLLEHGGMTVAVTLGGRERMGEGRLACYITDGGEECVIEARAERGQRVVDTTGAGDAFAAGFLYGMLQGRGIEECGRLGEIMSRFCIAEVGARSGLPSLGQLTQSYQQLYGAAL